MEATKNTPTPWEVGASGTHINAEDGSVYSIACCHWAHVGSNWSGTDYATKQHQLANAAFIVRACNAYAELVAALRGAESLIDILTLACIDRVDSVNDPRRAAITEILNKLAEA